MKQIRIWIENVCVCEEDGPSWCRECLYPWISSTRVWPETPRLIYRCGNNVLSTQLFTWITKVGKKEYMFFDYKSRNEKYIYSDYKRENRRVHVFRLQKWETKVHVFRLQKRKPKSTCILITKVGNKSTCILSYSPPAWSLGHLASSFPHIPLSLCFFLLLSQPPIFGS